MKKKRFIFYGIEMKFRVLNVSSKDVTNNKPLKKNIYLPNQSVYYACVQ